MGDVEKLFGEFKEKRSFKEEVKNMVDGICKFSSKELDDDLQINSSADEEHDPAKCSLAEEGMIDEVANFASHSNSFVEVIPEIFLNRERNDSDEEFSASLNYESASGVDVDDLTQDELQIDDDVASEDAQEEGIVHVNIPAETLGKMPIVVDDALIKKRAEQIFYFFTMKHNQDVAAVFHKLKECLMLKGDFFFLDIVLVSDF